jgi:DNA-binding transcriptional LysR family regulator
MSDLDLNAVTAFAKVAEEQSFRGAARLLGVSKSTLSQRVARLEERLGARLLSRTTRRVRLTDVGESYYQAVAPALVALQAADSLVEDLRQRPRGSLRLTAPVELGQSVLGDALAWFAERHPEVDILVELTDRQVNLVEEGFDLALRVGPLQDSSLVSRRVSEPHAKRLYASPDYLARHGTPLHPAALAEHACLGMTAHTEARTWRLHGPDGPAAIALRPKILINSWGVLRDLAVAGRGIARLPELNVRDALAAGSLVEVLAAFAPPPVACYAVFPSARNLSPTVRVMIGALIERLSEQSCRLDNGAVHRAPTRDHSASGRS